MRAYVTSIGEPTTDLCCWSLKRLGFVPILIKDVGRRGRTTLWEKLETIFDEAEDDFIRVDADTIVNSNIRELIEQAELWWYQTLTFDWYKQDTTHGGIQFIRKPALKAIKQHLHEAKDKDRPESYLFRLAEFHEPRLCGTFEKICGITGYHQNDYARVKAQKLRRGQYGNYDFELAERLDALCA